MRLLIDIGNTRVKYVVENHNADKTKSMLSSVKYLSVAELNEAFFSEHFFHIDEVIVASVNSDEKLAFIKKWADLHHKFFIQVNSEAERFGITSSYSQPTTLGIDRWLAMIGAATLYPNENVLIIDAGTAITIDLLNDAGKHEGGWIMPGLQTMFNSIMNSTTKVHATPLNIQHLDFGANSSECVNYGMWAMAIGAIKTAIAQSKQKLKLDHIILLGGDGERLAEILDENNHYIPELIFHGLRRFKVD